MKKLLLLLALFSLFSCSTDNELEDDNNLISNSSFEKNSEFSLLGWDGELTSPSTDTPENGGSYSLQLEPGMPPEEGFAETYVTNLDGAVSLDFSCDVKTIDWSGKIVVYKEDAEGNRSEITNFYFNNPEWTNISFDINTELENTDSMIVRLSAGMTEVTTGKVLFDNVMLTDN